MLRSLQFKCLAALLALALASLAPAQEVVFDDGEIVAGMVTKVENNRIEVTTKDGKILSLHPRRLRFARDAAGRVQRFPARLVTRLMNDAEKRLLARLVRGEAMIEPDLLQLTADCTADLVAALQKELSAKAPAVRAAAAAALALAATPETVKLALQTALEDPDADVRRAAAERLLGSAALAALAEADLRGELEKGLAEKDRIARYALAQAAVELGSEIARPVLARYVTDRDHHIKEEAALILARHGDAAGEKVLLQMLKRKESPAIAANHGADASLTERLHAADRRERLEVCSLVGALKLKSARSTLGLLAKDKDEELAATAKKSLEQIEG